MSSIKQPNFFGDSTICVVGNAILGCSPLWWMLFAMLISPSPLLAAKLAELLSDGIPFCVCCCIAGGISLDFRIARFGLSEKQSRYIYRFPFWVNVIYGIQFILKVLQQTGGVEVMSAWYSIFFAALSLICSILAKSLYYKLEFKRRNENRS